MTNEHHDLPNELTPPAHEGLSADRKLELRAQLLSAAQGSDQGHASRRPGWWASGLAAAAVAAVVGTGFYVTSRGDSTGSHPPLLPAGRSSSAADPTTASTPSPESPSSSAPGTPKPRLPVTPLVTVQAGPAPSFDPPPAQDCDDTLNEFVRQGHDELAGARVTASRAGDIGATYLYETKSSWVVCDDFASGDGGVSTLLTPHDNQQAYTPSAKTLTVSNNTIGGPNSANWHYQYFAAGADFDGVRAIAYTFPDGHTEDAVVGQNGLWSMNYQPTTGLLADPKTNYSKLGPITVDVTYAQSGRTSTDSFTLPWGEGTCGQTNHGC